MGPKKARPFVLVNPLVLAEVIPLGIMDTRGNHPAKAKGGDSIPAG
jgi:hypothetical protein